jgi:hypothetical protein
MILTSVLAHGRIALGPDAAAVGFVEGAIITVVVLSTGSVLIRLDDQPAVEVSARRTLPARAQRRARLPAPVPDCCVGTACAYQPRMIGLLRRARDSARASGDSAPAAGYDLARLLGVEMGDPSDHERERWAGILADLERAEQAGCVSDDDVSRYLCGRSC